MILHISNDFNHTKVHKELYYELDKLGLVQNVFIPLKDEKFKNRNHFDFKVSNSEFLYSDKLKVYHRFLFKNKIEYLYNSLLTKMNLQDIKLVHATTLFSDGALAFKLFKDYNIPYIVAIRSTDINFFFKYRRDLFALAKLILSNASKIVFISEASKRQFLGINSVKKILPSLRDKISKFNNGIDDFWIDNKSEYSNLEINNRDNCVNFLFVGDFIKRKNCIRLIEAVSKVREYKNVNINLHLVGRPGDQSDAVDLKVLQNKWIHYYGEIKDKNELKRIFDTCQYFTMVSHIETFGLVYIEALSQGKPVLYTKGQGIDFLFELNIGEKVNSVDSIDIEDKIQDLISKKYDDINLIDFEGFRWRNISNNYFELYKTVIDG